MGRKHRADHTPFRGWHLGNSNRYFRSCGYDPGSSYFGADPFGGIGGVFHDERIIYNIQHLLYVPCYSQKDHEIFESTGHVSFYAELIPYEGSAEAMRGDILAVFSNFERNVDAASKVAIVDVGYRALRAFMQRRYGWINFLSSSEP